MPSFFKFFLSFSFFFSLFSFFVLLVFAEKEEEEEEEEDDADDISPFFSSSSNADRVDLVRLRLELGDLDGEHSLAARRLDVGRVGSVGQREYPLESAEAPLDAAAHVGFLALLLVENGRHAQLSIAELELDVFSLDAGQVAVDQERILGLGHIRVRAPGNRRQRLVFLDGRAGLGARALVGAEADLGVGAFASADLAGAALQALGAAGRAVAGLGVAAFAELLALERAGIGAGALVGAEADLGARALASAELAAAVVRALGAAGRAIARLGLGAFASLDLAGAGLGAGALVRAEADLRVGALASADLAGAALRALGTARRAIARAGLGFGAFTRLLNLGAEALRGLDAAGAAAGAGGGGGGRTPLVFVGEE